MEDQREKDILALLTQIVGMSPSFHYNSNGPDWVTCPICSSSMDACSDTPMSAIEHDPNCGYLIAKDLSTNLLKP